MELVFPSFNMKNEAIDYVQEHFEYGETEIHGDGGLDRFANNYEQWIAKINTDLTRNDAGYVSATTYFAIADNRIIGTIQIRHRLNDTLLLYNGHIGYGVRPSERRKGHATQMLARAVEKCRELNIDKALVTCYKGNIGSAKTILNNGGVLENEVVENGQILQRYWIDTHKL